MDELLQAGLQVALESGAPSNGQQEFEELGDQRVQVQRVAFAVHLPQSTNGYLA